MKSGCSLDGEFLIPRIIKRSDDSNMQTVTKKVLLWFSRLKPYKNYTRDFKEESYEDSNKLAK